jgi:hypothetical protein
MPGIFVLSIACASIDLWIPAHSLFLDMFCHILFFALVTAFATIFFISL